MKRAYMPVLLTAAGIVAVACVDLQNTPSLPRSELNSTRDRNGVGVITEPRPVRRLKVDLSATGDMMPGSVVSVTATIEALMPATGVRAQVIAPEAAAASRNGYKTLGQLVGFHPTPLASDTRDLREGEVMVLHGQLTIPVAGFYSVSVAAISGEDKADQFDRRIQSRDAQTIWLSILPQHGRVSDRFDPSEVPDSIQPHPGPAILKGRFAVKGAGRDADEGRVNSIASPVPTKVSGLYSPGVRRMVYLDPFNSTYYPVPGAYYSWSEFDPYTNSTAGGGYNYTDDQGFFSEPCPADNGSYYDYMSGTVTSNGTFAHATHNGSDIIGGWDGGTPSSCLDQTGDWVVSDMYLGAATYMASLVLPRSYAIFGYLHHVDIEIDNVNSFGAQFNPSGNKIQYDTNKGFVLSVATFAHEYGHYLHYNDLGGFGSGACPSSGHGPIVVEGLDCAWKEGFADFHYITALRDTFGGSYTSIFEANYLFSQIADTVGEQRETPVTSFLANLVDSLPMTPSEVFNTVKQCRVDSHIITGSDEIVFCMERSIDSTVKYNYFTSRSPKQNAITALGPLPSGWSLSTVRRLWKKALYKK